MKPYSLFLPFTLLLATQALAQTPPQKPSGDHKPPSFSQMDTNGDGVLSESELQGPMQRDFSKIDADGDGSVTESELDTFMKNHRPPGPPPSENSQQTDNDN